MKTKKLVPKYILLILVRINSLIGKDKTEELKGREQKIYLKSKIVCCMFSFGKADVYIVCSGFLFRIE